MGDNSTLTDDQCVDINTTLSWTLPPDLMIDMEEDYDGVVVAGTSVTVDFEDVTRLFYNICRFLNVRCVG